MCGVGESVAVREVELLVVDVVKEHIDTSEVVCSQVDFLAEEPVANVIFPKDFRELE